MENFLRNKLMFVEDEIRSMGDFSFEKVGYRAKKIVGEHVVTFRTSEIRDLVRATAKNLAGDNLSEMRLHLPGHLESNFKALESISYALKQKHPTLKRNIKYDDANRDLQLDFQINPGQEWQTILPEQARKYNATQRTENTSNRSMTVDDISTVMSDVPVV